MMKFTALPAAAITERQLPNGTYQNVNDVQSNKNRDAKAVGTQFQLLSMMIKELVLASKGVAIASVELPGFALNSKEIPSDSRGTPPWERP